MHFFKPFSLSAPRALINRSHFKFIATRSFTNSAAIGKLIYPESPSSQHKDLVTFLAHAKRTGLDEESTVYVGTHYEYTVAQALARYGFHLKRIGGASDFGIDLLGTWTPPSTSHRLKILIQCKAGALIGPRMIRELEGAFVGAPAGWRGKGVLAWLVGERPATKGVREGLGRSKWPMGYVFCERGARVRQVIWNRRAEEEGLEGFGVTSRFVDAGDVQELVLMRNGRILPLLGAEK